MKLTHLANGTYLYGAYHDEFTIISGRQSAWQPLEGCRGSEMWTGRSTKIGALHAAITDRDEIIRAREKHIIHLEESIIERELRVKEREAKIEEFEEILRFRKIDASLADLGERFATEMKSRPWLNEIICDIRLNVDGWCSERKALRLADIVIVEDCQRILEIGLYEGRSLIPMALAARYKGSGRIWGVEAWDNQIAVESPTNDENDTWWSSLNLLKIKGRFFTHLGALNLWPWVSVLELSSDQGFSAFSNTALFDLIHIDGGHSEAQALRDAKLWSSLLRPDGILIFDDIFWDSARQARAWILENFAVIEETEEEEGVAYGVYRKIPHRHSTPYGYPGFDDPP